MYFVCFDLQKQCKQNFELFQRPPYFLSLVECFLPIIHILKIISCIVLKYVFHYMTPQIVRLKIKQTNPNSFKKPYKIPHNLYLRMYVSIPLLPPLPLSSSSPPWQITLPLQVLHPKHIELKAISKTPYNCNFVLYLEYILFLSVWKTLKSHSNLYHPSLKLSL